MKWNSFVQVYRNKVLKILNYLVVRENFEFKKVNFSIGIYKFFKSFVVI